MIQHVLHIIQVEWWLVQYVGAESQDPKPRPIEQVIWYRTTFTTCNTSVTVVTVCCRRPFLYFSLALTRRWAARPIPLSSDCPV